MNPYAISVIARIKQNERLAEAERTRQSNLVRRARRRGDHVATGTSVPVTDPLCSTA
jgi:hypothetical protein